MSELRSLEELLKIGYKYDIRLKNDTEFHDCQLLDKDLDCRMIKIRHYLEVAEGRLKIFREEMINMDEIFRVTFPRKSRYFWIYIDSDDNTAYLHDLRLTDQDVKLNKEIKFYDSVDDAVKAVVIEKIAKSENPKNCRLLFHGSSGCIAKHTGYSLKNGGWEGSRSQLVDETLSKLGKQPWANSRLKNNNDGRGI